MDRQHVGIARPSLIEGIDRQKRENEPIARQNPEEPFYKISQVRVPLEALMAKECTEYEKDIYAGAAKFREIGVASQGGHTPAGKMRDQNEQNRDAAKTRECRC